MAKREEDLALAETELDKIKTEKCELEKDLQSKKEEIVVDDRELERLKMILQLEEQRKKEANRSENTDTVSVIHFVYQFCFVFKLGLD